MKLECGLQLYTLRDHTQSKAKLPQVFDFVASTGATTMELAMGCLPKDVTPKELHTMASNSGLSICGTHSDFDRIKNDIDRLADEHLTMGAKSIGIGGMPRDYAQSLDDLNEFCDIMNEASEKISDRNLKVSYHNHAFEFTEKFEGTPIYDILVDKGNFAFCLDVYWAIVGKVDPMEYMDKLDGNLIFIHMKDMKKRLFKFLPPKMAAPGKGIIDYLSVLEKAESSGAECALIEVDSSVNHKQAVVDGMNFLKENYLGRD